MASDAKCTKTCIKIAQDQYVENSPKSYAAGCPREQARLGELASKLQEAAKYE